jgi:hypothetical protein
MGKTLAVRWSILKLNLASILAELSFNADKSELEFSLMLRPHEKESRPMRGG